MVAGGDFAGNVFVFSTDRLTDMEPTYTVNIVITSIISYLKMESVRTLVFDSKDESILVGTLGGKIYRWFIKDSSSEPKVVAHFDHGVINMKYNNSKQDGNFLLAGLASGMFIALKEVEYEPSLQIMFAYHGHFPQSDANKYHFGSLRKNRRYFMTLR